MRVLICDDHTLFGEGFRFLLESLHPQAQVTTVTTVEDAERAAGRGGFDLVLLDWNLERGPSGAEALARLREAAAAARIVVLSGEKNARLVRHMIELGAAGFIPKWLRKGELQAALTSVLAGGIFLPPEFHWDVREPEPVAEVSGDLRQAFPTLTERQADVLRIVLRGCPDKLVARELGISLNTVRTHMRTIFEELGVQSRGQAVYLASRRGVRIA